ncbi:MAG: NTP transferase domain-containing protein [Methanomicrobiales archaeon]|nr:NTP transferase domain-containing protein [Methanomicrobiales archaeon]
MECVVLAAGEGKRMRPLTASRPKVMLPIANRPMIEYLIAATRDAGIDRFVLVVGYREKEIRSYFGDGSALGVSIRYATQRRQLGTGDAVRSVRDLVSGRFLLLNGDMLLSAADCRALGEADAPCMGIFRSDHPQQYGVVTVSDGRVTGLVEKSPNPPSSLINAGAYVFNQDIFDLVDAIGLSERGEYELTDALMAYIRKGTLSARTLSSWCDVGEPWSLLDANETMLADLETRIDGEVEEGVTIHGPVVVGKGSVVRAGTYITGPCVIGEDCVIGPHAFIRGSTAIGDGCHIGHATEIKNSIVFEGTKIPHFNYVGDSVIGSGCNFGAGTKIANLRHDRGIVRACGRETGRKKFGAVIGDGVQFGINCSVNTGSVVGSNVRVAPHSLVEGCISDGTVIGR